MLRLGKETDDVEVIDTNTGEWEFPFNFNAGDGLSLSGPTGHHSGGETHGCEGFTYMINVDLLSNPPEFRFRKEMFHVNYDDHPEGKWTHPDAPDVIVGGGWFGYGWVRYNRAGGRQDGGDSVVLEAWWNNDPAGGAKWVMLKRIEDKGEGITNWGDGGDTCDGTKHQVGTWSNIQFRFKVDASDFSLHPLEPETNEGSNIHSIDEEDMSFSDSEARGYGYQARMPRDIEMKCLFKFSDQSGRCRFKNVSLREIDPTIGFDDGQNNPPPGEQPGELEEVQGFLRLYSDINTITDSSCAPGGLTEFDTILPDNFTSLADHTSDNNRTVAAQQIRSLSPWVGKLVKLADFAVEKVGSPGASPVVTAKIWDENGNVLYTSPTTFDPSTLSAVNVNDPDTWPTFDFSSNTHALAVNDRIGVEYLGTSTVNKVEFGWLSHDQIANVNYSIMNDVGTPWSNNTAKEVACRLFE